MESETMVRIPLVRAVSDGLALVCELQDGTRFGVPFARIDRASDVQRAGDAGDLIVPADVAARLGITIARATRLADEAQVRAIAAYVRALVRRGKAVSAARRATTLTRREVHRPRKPH